MNDVILRGQLRDIQPSHTIGDIEYEQANLITIDKANNEDIICVKFKKYSNIHKEGDIVDIKGNLRSYSKKLDDGHNKVQLYVFTYFDTPDTDDENYADITNQVIIDGRICKVDDMRTTKTGKQNLHFILANNIISEDNRQKLNNYIPSVAWGKLANQLKNIKINDKIKLQGELHSRTYKKQLENGDLEIRTAHELLVTKVLELNDEKII